MNRQAMESDRRGVRDMRIALAALLGLSMAANLVLSHGLANRERMARRDLATAFYPERIDVEPDALAATVSGELVTWLGREEATRMKKRYRLVFRIDGGRIGLLRFEEWEDER